MDWAEPWKRDGAVSKRSVPTGLHFPNHARFQVVVERVTKIAARHVGR